MDRLGEGERKAAQRRRTFWMSIVVLMASGAVVGFFIGSTAARRDLAIGDIWASLPRPLAVGIVALALAAFFYGTWRFTKAIDEVELADNLWGSTASYYVYATLFPTWWALSKIDLVPEPNDWAIFLAALGGGGAIYLWRKWRAR
jgi:hypothetical protein